MIKKINIALCMNSRYVMPSMVCMVSVLENNNVPVSFFILHSDLNDNEVYFMKHVIKKCNNDSELIAIKVGADTFKNCPINGRAKEAYYRLLIPWLLPEDLERCLYLDSDIIVNKSLVDYYNSSFDDKLLIASEDIGEIIFFHKKQHARLDIPKEFRYFNSGVLLFDLPAIRKNIVLNDIFSFIKNKSQHLKFLDQDVLNGLFYNKTNVISGSIYNYPEILVNPLISNNGISEAVFIHFFQKPWKFNYRGINQNIWWKYGRKFFPKKYYLFLFINFFYKKVLGVLLIFFSIDFVKKINKAFK